MLKTILQTSSAAILTMAIGSTTAFAQSSGGTIDEIVITAQRVEESLQDAAVAVEAVDQATLTRQGLESAQDLGRLSPALGINAGGGPLTSLFIRGVGALTVNPLTDAAVAQNVDGVYMGRSSGAAGQSLYDLERVELLKGPQGTLYGRNATGGVINYIPQKPIYGENSGYGQVEYGNYNKLGVQGALNLAVDDVAAFRIAGNLLKRDGFSDDGTNDADSLGVRAQAMFDVGSSTTIRIAADYAENNAKGGGGDFYGNYNTAGDRTVLNLSDVPIDSGPTSDASNAARRGVLHAPSFAFFRDINSDDLYQDLSFTGVMAEINHQFSAGTLTVIPAYRESDQDYQFAGPGFAPATTNEQNNQTSLEARFASDFDGAFNGILGAFYIDEEVQTSTAFAQQYSSPIQNYENGGDSWAVFGQGTFDVSDNFRLNAGLRYTEDNKFASGVSDTFVIFCGGAPFPPPLPNNLNPGGNPAVGEDGHDGNFPVGYSSFANGCHIPGNIPTLAITSDPDELIADLVAQGRISPNQSDSPGPGWVISRLAGDMNPNRLATLTNLGDGFLESDLSYNEVTYRVGVEYDWGPSNLLYAGYERGYRAGGVDLSDVSPTYDSEYIDAFTIGSKNRFLDNSLQVNAEAFLWQYTDQQVTYFTMLGGPAAFPIANGDADIMGVDVDVIWAATDNTTLYGNVQFLDSNYDRLELIGDTNTQRFDCPVDRVETVGEPGDQYDIDVFDCSGQSLLSSPEFGLDLGVNHIFNLDNFNLSLTADGSYRSEQSTSFTFLPETKAESYLTLDLDATISPEDEGWSLSVFMRNVTDERYFNQTNVSSRGKLYAIHNPPQTYGARIRANF